MRVSGWIVYILIAMLAIPGRAFPHPPPTAESEPFQEAAPTSRRSAATGTERSTVPPQAAKSLRILPLEGDGAINYIPAQSATVPVVEVHNENDMPVEGATVVFQLPAMGPGGYFPDKKLSLRTVTNSRGQAVARGFRINSEPGRFSMRVTALYQNLTATYVLTQTNSMKAREAMAQHKSRKWLWIGIACAAAAAGGATYALRSNSSPRISASAGPVVIAAP